jgi:hypothetical protein
MSTKGKHDGLRKDDPGLFGPAKWSPEQLAAMNGAFSQRLLDATAAGLEQCVVGISTKAGTKWPLYGYTRD